jgi:hypothetical protein
LVAEALSPKTEDLATISFPLWVPSSSSLGSLLCTERIMMFCYYGKARMKHMESGWDSIWHLVDAQQMAVVIALREASGPSQGLCSQASMHFKGSALS